MTTLKAARFTDKFKAETFDSPQSRYVEGLCAQAPQSLFKEGCENLIAYNDRLATTIGIVEKTDIEPYLLGQKRSNYSFSYNYGGHQFGHWADQLGDGRALVIGEVENSKGERTEIQLKGSGPTPFSRRGDGFAVMRSSVREFLASEMMAALNIPTTGALSLSLTGEDVFRDKFYDGHGDHEQGALLARTAPSFLRFGNFELLSARDQVHDLEELITFTCDSFYPKLSQESNKIQDLSLKLLETVSKKTARLIAQWQKVGFVHGVMNTDNMSILGLSIDYGPYGYMDAFDPNFTPNTTDLPHRRYCFGRQAAVAKWNLACLGSSLQTFLDKEAIETVLDTYDRSFMESWNSLLSSSFAMPVDSEERVSLINEFFSLLQKDSMNMNFTLRELSESLRDNTTFPTLNCQQVYPMLSSTLWQSWFETYIKELKDSTQAGIDMCSQNPRILPWNFILHQIIKDIEKDDHSSFLHIWDLLRRPYEDLKGDEEWYLPKPKLSRQRQIMMNSCSS